MSSRPAGSKKAAAAAAAKERLAAERARQAAERRRQQQIRAGAAIAVLVLIVGLGVLYQTTRTKVDTGAARPAAVTAVGGGIPIGTGAGAPGTPVVDVYEDFQCPACGKFERTVGSVLGQLAAEGKAKVVFYPLSFLGEESVRAANAFGCAADAGKAEQFHTALFAGQPAEHSGGYQNADLIKAGEQERVGITGEEFATCVNDGRYNGWVKQVARTGEDRGVSSTPTIFVGGKELAGDAYTAEGIKAAVQAATK